MEYIHEKCVHTPFTKSSNYIHVMFTIRARFSKDAPEVIPTCGWERGRLHVNPKLELFIVKITPPPLSSRRGSFLWWRS
jgi:hypothetical protein